MIWKIQHSEIANVKRSIAWEFYSNIDNWTLIEGTAVELFSIDGPFKTDTKITTIMPGQEPRYSRLTEVYPPTRVVIEMDINDAIFCCTWEFEEISDEQTGLRQNIVLEGTDIKQYLPFMEENFAKNKGMKRIAKEMERYASISRSCDPK